MVGTRFSRRALWLTVVTFTLAACGMGAPSPPIQVPVPSTAAEASTGFDNRSNGAANDSIHQADQDAFDEVEEIAHGSGALYSAAACLCGWVVPRGLCAASVTTLCNSAYEPSTPSDSSGLADSDRFTRFLRAAKAPARDTVLAATPAARRGSALFDAIGCATCHVRTLVTAAAGTILNGGADTIPPALGEKAFHPFGDYLLHNVGTGDGIVMAMPEHYGPAVYKVTWREFSIDSVGRTRNKVRTAPLWGVRLRPRLMHDGASLTLRNAIGRHRGEASGVYNRFRKQTQSDQAAIIAFLESL